MLMQQRSSVFGPKARDNEPFGIRPSGVGPKGGKTGGASVGHRASLVRRVGRRLAFVSLCCCCCCWFVRRAGARMGGWMDRSSVEAGKGWTLAGSHGKL